MKVAVKGAVKLDPRDAAYPPPMLDLDEPPVLTVSGPLEPSRVVAIVGSRRASGEAKCFAHQLAYHLAAAGIVVVSGGAVGVDWAAHTGAMKRGATWCVAPCGRGEVFPPANEDLFAEIESSNTSRMIWPFPDGTPKDTLTPRYRNGVLVSLASAVIVVQAAVGSGSIHAARITRELRRPLYVVPGMPWSWEFHGSKGLIMSGATPLWSVEQLFDELDLPAPDIADPEALLSGRMPLPSPIRTNKRRGGSSRKQVLLPLPAPSLTPEEERVKSILSPAPTQRDRIIEEAGLGTSATLTALLTLSLKDVVVEAPDGFFRLNKAS
ncbi:MAG: DNA-processing protein DprA [Labilithrix sp.]|nr:DNA-processing protein DprA [Labilithrix sp.]MCW5816065.1 DNA-processing protein DprA [Labilithrix sp.]